MTTLRQSIQSSGNQPLLGTAIFHYSPHFLELCSSVGFRVAWIEMEHGFLTYSQVADLCRIASGVGMLTMVRIAEASRESVLKAAECCPDIIDLPMANSPDDVARLVRFARYPPEGERGFFNLSRRYSYALNGEGSEVQKQINEELCLMAQIETKEAVLQAEDICGVAGLDAIFVGPGDLSSSFGIAGNTGHSLVREAGARAIKVARGAGKDVAVYSGKQDFGFWLSQGVDILFCANDITCLREGVRLAAADAEQAIGSAKK